MTDVANCGSFIVLIEPVVKQVFRCNSSENKVVRVVRVISFYVLQRGTLEDKQTLLWADSGTKEK